MEKIIELSRAERLEVLGFKRASDNLKKMADKKRKLMLAYENFRFVRQEKIDAFNQKLRKQTSKIPDGFDWGATYKTLSFTGIENYKEIPPDHVLDSLSRAKEFKCFDAFEVAHIVEVKDPILFGRVDECSDRFFIDQWDDDVKIEDILMPNEG